MSDRDANHLLVELQEARHFADSNQKAFLKANERCVELMELLRWRNTESEVPEENEFCLVIVKGSAWPNVIRHSGTFPWSQSVITHWRPIGPLPKEIE